MCFLPGHSEMELLDEIANELYSEEHPDRESGTVENGVPVIETGEPDRTGESTDPEPSVADATDPDFINDESDTETTLLDDDGGRAGPR